MDCSKCGKELFEEAKFCPFCGEPVVFEEENIEFDDADENDFLKDELHQEFTVYDYDEGDNVVEKILDYDLKTGKLSITDRDGNVIFSAECDAPQLNEDEEIIKTYYYINDFDKIDLNHIFYRKDKWKIYNLINKEYFTVKQYDEDKDSKVISEFDSISYKASGNIFEYGFDGNFGLIKFNKVENAEDNETTWEILPLAECKYFSIIRSDRGFVATNNFDTDIIDENIGVIKTFNGQDVALYYSDNNCHITFENKYMTYNIPSLENMLNGSILYEDKELEPANEYEIEKKINDLYICSNYQNIYGVKKYGLFNRENLILNFEYDRIKPLYEHYGTYLFKVFNLGCCGIYNDRGNFLLPMNFIDIKIHKINLSSIELTLFNYDKKYLANIEYQSFYESEKQKVNYIDVTDTYEDFYWLFDDEDFVDKTNKYLMFDKDSLVIKEKDSTNDYLSDDEFETAFGTEKNKENGNATTTNLIDDFESNQISDDIILGDNIALYKDNEFYNIHNKFVLPGNPFDINSWFYENNVAVYGSLIICCKSGNVKLYNIYYYNTNTKEFRKIADAKYTNIIKHKTKNGYVLLCYYSEEDDNIFSSQKYYLDIVGKDGVKYTINLQMKNAPVSYVNSINNKLHIVLKDNYSNNRYLVINKNKIEKEYKVIFSNESKYIGANNDKLVVIEDSIIKEAGILLETTNDYIIFRKDGLVGVINKKAEIIIPLRYSSIEILNNDPDNLILNYFGKKGVVLLSENKVDYVVPCEYERIDMIAGSDIKDSDCENSIKYINSYEYYLRVVKMGRVAYYDLDGNLVVHFRIITTDDSF